MNQNIINTLFTGFLTNYLQCTKCKTSKRIYDPFQELTLTLTDSNLLNNIDKLF